MRVLPRPRLIYGRRKVRPKNWRALPLGGFFGMLVLLLGAGQAANSSGPKNSTPAETQSHTLVALPAPIAGPGALDVPLQLIAAARQTYQQTRDYTCLFVKRERIRGELQPENLVVMKVRSQPFSVYLRWQKPDNMAGQEACYVSGRNNGMMRAHSTGLLGAVGFISIAPNDPRALENSRHAITEAGIGNLIERFGPRWEVERGLNKTWGRVAEYEYNRRRCIRVETIHPDNSGNHFLFYRSIVYFDKEHHLPIRCENYDWPRPGGDANGELVECYSYADLRLNVGLTDATFNH